MHIDAHAARALELTRAQDAHSYAGAGGGISGISSSVLRQLDKTLTAGGSRCLQAWLLRPLVDTESIAARQDAGECFVFRPALRRQVRDVLEGVGDMQRCVRCADAKDVG
jgi:DNA mismatch repair protein MutS